MPFATVDNIRLFYRLEGKADAPVLVLSHSIGTTTACGRRKSRTCLPHFQVLRYDTRGHGASDAPAGEYSVERLGRDVIALADELKISKFAFCGLSMGGAIGQWLALNASGSGERSGAGQHFTSIRTADELGDAHSDRVGKRHGWTCRYGHAAIFLLRNVGSRRCPCQCGEIRIAGHESGRICGLLRRATRCRSNPLAGKNPNSYAGDRG